MSNKFQQFIKHLLSDYCELADEFVDKLTNSENIKQYINAFTTQARDAENNYEFYEFVGDKVLNYNILKFLVNKFPELQKPSLKGYLDKIHQRYIQKDAYAEYARKLKYQDYIRKNDDSDLT